MKESGGKLWPYKNILNSATPGSIWFLFIPSLPPVKLALNTSARWPPDSPPNMKGPLSVPGVAWLTLWEAEKVRGTQMFIYVTRSACRSPKRKQKKQPISELQINHGAFSTAITWRSGSLGRKETYERSRQVPKSKACKVFLGRENVVQRMAVDTLVVTLRSGPFAPPLPPPTYVWFWVKLDPSHLTFGGWVERRVSQGHSCVGVSAATHATLFHLPNKGRNSIAAN